MRGLIGRYICICGGYQSSQILVEQSLNNSIYLMSRKITEIRLKKEEESIIKEPVSQAIVVRSDLLTFHFCLYGLEESYTGGFYHGVLDLPEDYPFAPPKIRFLTPSGRFQVNKTICTTFTHYHKETWSSSWNIRTIVTALISFMYANEPGIGGIFESSSRRTMMAKKSLTENFKNKEFVQLFADKLQELKLISTNKRRQIQHKLEKEAKTAINETQVNENTCQIDPFQIFVLLNNQPRVVQELPSRKRMLEKDEEGDQMEPALKRVKTERDVSSQNEQVEAVEQRT